VTKAQLLKNCLICNSPSYGMFVLFLYIGLHGAVKGLLLLNILYYVSLLAVLAAEYYCCRSRFDDVSVRFADALRAVWLPLLVPLVSLVAEVLCSNQPWLGATLCRLAERSPFFYAALLVYGGWKLLTRVCPSCTR